MLRRILTTPAAVAALSLAAAAPAAETADRDLLPGGTVLSTVSPAEEIETFRVAAPAGSVLSVDLRPAARGAFAPSLEALLPDGVAFFGPLPPGRPDGRVKARLPFAVDGTIVLRVGSASGTGDYRMRTRLRAPRGVLLEGSVPAGAEGQAAFLAPPGAIAKVKVVAAEGSPLVPRIALVAADGPIPTPLLVRPGARSDLWTGLRLDAPGPWTLSVGGAEGTSGPFVAAVKWKVPRGPDLDLRDADLPGLLKGDYSMALATGTAGTLLSGTAAFDGKGGIAASVAAVPLLPAGGGLPGLPLFSSGGTAVTGTYRTDGVRASIVLGDGAGGTVEADLAVARGGEVLWSDAGGALSLAVRRVPSPTVAGLAGSWAYVNAVRGAAGSSTTEVGNLSFTSSGGVSGLGLRTEVTLVDGVPTPGAESAVFRSGSFSVLADGTVRVVTRANLFGPEEAWTASAVLGQEVLAGGGPEADPASESRAFLRQGTGLGAADVAGPYLHFGLLSGAASSSRTGVLAFDGAGGFSGTETATDLAGGIPSSVATTGSYSVDGTGLATFSPDGGVPGSGVVGPAGDYLFTFGFGAAGAAVDFLLALE